MQTAPPLCRLPLGDTAVASGPSFPHTPLARSHQGLQRAAHSCPSLGNRSPAQTPARPPQLQRPSLTHCPLPGCAPPAGHCGAVSLGRGPGTVSRHCSRTDEFLISAGTQGHWGCSVDLVSSLFTVGPWTRLSPLQPPQTSQSASGVQRPGLLVPEAAALLFSVSYTHGHPYFSLSRLAPSPPCAALDGALGRYRRLAAGGRAAPQAHSLAAGPLCWAGPASCWSPPRNPTCRGPAR